MTKQSKQAKSTKKKKEKKTKVEQKGTGLHLDCNPYNLWRTQQKDGKYIDLEWWRPFQSFVALTDCNEDRSVSDGGLEIVPGFFSVCERYFKEHSGGPTHGRNLFRWGSYNTKFSKKHDEWALDKIRRAQRIPEDWEDDSSLLTKSSNECTKISEYQKYVEQTVAMHDALDFVPIQKGDFVLWDMRTPHQNSNTNDSDYIRSVFYHAYMVAEPSNINQSRINSYKECREKREHIPDFPKTWRELEKKVPVTPLETRLAKLLYNEESWNGLTEEQDFENLMDGKQNLLTDKHVQFMKRFGYVVIENVFERQVVDSLFYEAVEFCEKNGCNLLSARDIKPSEWASIAGRFGAMLELFYQPTMEKIRFDPSCYAITAKLCSETWEKREGDYEHPFEGFDGRKLWLYIDRMNFRYPSNWPKQIEDYVENSRKRKLSALEAEQVSAKSTEEPKAKRRRKIRDDLFK